MKLKRLFTAVLSTALALSLCAMPAMAADSAAATMPKTSTSTIDKNQEGSITIYKRALDSSGNAGTASDGETILQTIARISACHGICGSSWMNFRTSA